VGGEDRAYDGAKKIKGRKRRHLLVDTEGFVLKVKLHSAKVRIMRGSRSSCGKQIRNFPACVICGWMRATEERIRARRTGWRRPWGGA